MAEVAAHMTSGRSSLTMLDKVLAGLAALVVVVFLVFVGLAVSGRAGLLIVKSGSMAPGMAPGSLIVFSAASIEDVTPGQVIVFRDPLSPKSLVTHRAVGKFYENGSPYLRTKGDSNRRADESPISRDQVVGVGICAVPMAGRALAFAKTAQGMLTLNFLLALFALLVIVDRVKARERTRFAQTMAGEAEKGSELIVVPGTGEPAALESC